MRGYVLSARPRPRAHGSDKTARVFCAGERDSRCMHFVEVGRFFFSEMISLMWHCLARAVLGRGRESDAEEESRGPLIARLRGGVKVTAYGFGR